MAEPLAADSYENFLAACHASMPVTTLPVTLVALKASSDIAGSKSDSQSAKNGRTQAVVSTATGGL